MTTGGTRAPRRMSATLPKHLVNKLGQEKVRELLGLNPELGSTIKRVRSAKTRRVMNWLRTTNLETFRSCRVAQYCDMTSQSAAGILRGMPADIVVAESYTDQYGQRHGVIWRKVRKPAVVEQVMKGEAEA